jgi:RNase P/RNase MRP subunit POP5
MVIIERDRYIVFRILPENTKTNLVDLKTIVWSMYQRLFGLDGTTSSGLFFEEYSEESNIGIIRCSSTSLTHLMISLAMIISVNNEPLLIFPLYVTGLINKAKKYISSVRKS